MAEFSNHLENALINATLRGVSYTSPTSVFVGLYTSDPTDANTGTEVSGGSYARQSATFTAPSGGLTETDADITFPQATGSWGTVTHLGILDASTGGNLLYHTLLTTPTGDPAPKIIDAGDVFRIVAGSLTVQLS